MNNRQFLVPTGVLRGDSALTGLYTGFLGRLGVFSGRYDAGTDVAMTDVPLINPPRVDRATQFYNHRVAPIVEPAFAVAANGLKHGIKRAADFAIANSFAKAAKAYIEIKHSTEDGLVIKRFKKLPVARRKRTSLARLTNTLPVQQLKQLLANEFCWSSDPLKHLRATNHKRARDFLDTIVQSMKNSDFVYFPDIHHVLDMRALPESATSLLEEHGRQPGLSVFLHNHMIAFYHKNDIEHFRQSGFEVLQKLDDLSAVHHHTYYEGGRIPAYKMLHIKPTGPIEIPYQEHGTLAHCERLKLLNCIKMVQFILAERNSFNQTFPVNTFAGMIADFDAIRKDQLPPSYIDWPGKDHLRTPGGYPENEMENMLFDFINFNDFEIDRMWDEWHPSPSKDVTSADYRTPLRKAMQKNELVFDKNGQLQARKGALKKKLTDWKAIENRCKLEIIQDADKRLDIDMKTPEKKSASFIDSPIAFYIPSTNVPVQQGKYQSHEASKTPINPQNTEYRAAVVDHIQAAQVVEDGHASIPRSAIDQVVQPTVVAQAIDVIQTPDVVQTTDVDQKTTNAVHPARVAHFAIQQTRTEKPTASEATVPPSAWSKSMWNSPRPRRLVVVPPPFSSRMELFVPLLDPSSF